MKKFLPLLALLLGACEDTRTPEQKLSAARIEAARAKAEQNEEATREEREWYAFVRNNSKVLCINGFQYLAWVTYTSGHSTGSSRSMIPLFNSAGGRPLTCSGGVSKQLD